MEQSSKGFSKITIGIASAAIASYTMNWFSLRGVNFEALGFPSEMVKASMTGAITGFFVGITPHSVVDSMVNVIIFLKSSWKRIREASEKE